MWVLRLLVLTGRAGRWAAFRGGRVLAGCPVGALGRDSKQGVRFCMGFSPRFLLPVANFPLLPPLGEEPA